MAEFHRLRYPLDPFPYPRDSRSAPVHASLPDGAYVFVQDALGVVHVLPDGPHLHPKVLGTAAPALYAGELTIMNRVVVELTNCSGTFQFDDREGLRRIAELLAIAGLSVGRRAVRFFPPDGGPIEILE